MENTKILLSKIRHLVELDNKQKEEARKRGEIYNIFSVLRVETAEMGTHSAFLASLLNPDSDHGMGDAFLQSFIEKMNCNALQLETNKCTVEVEHFTGNGRIDISITDKNASKAIVVENKIYAGDQPSQMKRYYDYAKTNYKGGFCLLYLTLDGHEPSVESLEGLSDEDYTCVSYRNDILPWLEQCARIAYEKPLVRETINQYISLIKILTGMNSQDDIKQEVINMMATKENFQTAALVANNFVEIKKQIINKVLRPQLEERLKEIPQCSISGFRYGEGNYSGIDIKVSLWLKAHIRFEFEKYSGTEALIYGINWPEGRPSNIIIPGFTLNNIWVYRNHPQYYSWGENTFDDIFNGKVVDAFMASIKELLEIVKQQNLAL